MVGTEPEDQVDSVASRPRVTQVFGDQLLFDGAPELHAVRPLDFYDNGVDAVDRHDV